MYGSRRGVYSRSKSKFVFGVSNIFDTVLKGLVKIVFVTPHGLKLNFKGGQ